MTETWITACAVGAVATGAAGRWRVATLLALHACAYSIFRVLDAARVL